MAKGDDKIEMTMAQVDEMVSRKVAAALAGQAGMSEDDKFHAEMAQRKGTDKPALPTSTVKGVVSETGASFDPLIDHRGAVAQLENYTLPAGARVHQDEDGLLPNGHPLAGPVLEQHLYETYWRADLNRFIGKPLPKHFYPAKA